MNQVTPGATTIDEEAPTVTKQEGPANASPANDDEPKVFWTARKKVILGILLFCIVIGRVVVGILFAVGVTSPSSPNSSVGGGGGSGPAYNVEVYFDGYCTFNPYNPIMTAFPATSYASTTLREGGNSDVWSSGNRFRVNLHSIQGETAHLKATVNYECCTYTWNDATDRINDGSGTYSTLYGCSSCYIEPNVGMWCDHQVRIKVDEK
jgi:hypothetical protein